MCAIQVEKFTYDSDAFVWSMTLWRSEIKYFFIEILYYLLMLISDIQTKSNSIDARPRHVFS